MEDSYCVHAAYTTELNNRQDLMFNIDKNSICFTDYIWPHFKDLNLCYDCSPKYHKGKKIA